jgi:hypothetical protein
MAASNVLFAFVLVLGAGFFALNVQRLVRYMQLGRSSATPSLARCTR